MAERSPSPSTPAQLLAEPLLRFIQLENAGAIALVVMSIIALVWANSPWSASYHQLWHVPVSIGVGTAVLSLPLETWVNDGLMAVFFFAVGLEIKREIVLGELSSPSRAMLPVVGAVGGMVVPALIYAAFHAGSSAASGWGIPMATDIAFAVAALAVLGDRVPSSLKIFLLALAIADDLGAVLVIALFYTENILLGPLLGSFVLLALVWVMNVSGVRAFFAYWLVGIGVWLFMHESGVHATVAGVLLGILTPATAQVRPDSIARRATAFAQKVLRTVRRERPPDPHRAAHLFEEAHEIYVDSQSPLDYLLHQLERFVALVVMPVFALANAGVVLDASVFNDETSRLVAVAVALGLLLGKPIGVGLFSLVAVRLGVAVLPDRVGFGAIFGAGLLAGIGFTMSLFITALAFDTPLFIAGSKLGIFAASLLAAGLGIVVLRRSLPAES